MVRNRVPYILLLLVVLLAAGSASVYGSDFRQVPADLPLPWPDGLPGRAAVLVEVGTGTEVYAKSPDLVIPPASLTKLVAIHVVMEAVAAGETSLDAVMTVPAEAAASAMPPDSSLMFLDTGQQVSVEELLLGLVVSSGNDAAVAIGILVAGSEDAFVARMNASVHAMGLRRTSFSDISGLSSENTTTAGEFAQFVAFHLSRFPELRSRLYSQVEFAYPKPHNLAPGTTNAPIVQRNRNLLVGTDPRVDGLKTGFIEESGYNIAVSAQEGSLDFIAVVLGVEASNHSAGGRLRAEAANELIDFGFNEFEVVLLEMPPIQPVKIWEGTVDEIIPVGAPSEILLPSMLLESLTGRVFQETEATAPLARGTVLGTVVYSLGEIPYYEVDLVTPTIVDAAGTVRRLWDRLIRRLTRGR